MQIVRKIQPVGQRRKVSVSRILLAASLTLPAGTANGQTQTNLSGYVNHVIIVVQENRTPTNLFLQDQTLINNHAHLVSTGTCNNPEYSFPLTPDALGTCYDPQHNHQLPSADWINMWDKGAMDGACNIALTCGPGNQGCPYKKKCVPAACPDPNYTYCPQMTYVQNTVQSNGHGILQPYFDLANQYGYANYMFQTNQGASGPAHLFLFSGTSAPDFYNDPNSDCNQITPPYPCWQWFDAENASKVGSGDPYGCPSASTVYAYDIDPVLVENPAYTPPAPLNYPGFPCYSHNSLPTLLDPAGISWRYYPREKANGYTLWNAPAGINNICGNDVGPGNPCTGTDYTTSVQPYLPCQSGGKYGGDCAPILTDIENCNLANVSWVIPDGNWSDHGGFTPGDGGPSWVAWIVNAVGNNPPCGSNQNGPSGETYWKDTVILVVWDDWGGMYDDVAPPDCPGPGQCSGYYNGGSGQNGEQYVYGFRVPLLVIGAYTKNYPDGYISGAGAYPPVCTPPNSYCHDFGSILNFVEYAFAPTGTRLGGQYGIGGQNWPYADYFAMDYDLNHSATTYSLSDFFNFSPAGYHGFTPITSWFYPEKCFHVPNQTGCFLGTYPADPDSDANESD